MAASKNGECLCGAVKVEIVGEPKFTIRCYCKDCRHISGGGHLPQVMMKREQVTVSGAIKSHKWKSASANDVELGFCGNCGSPIYKPTTMMKGNMSVLVGSLNDSSSISFKNSAYQDSRQPWDKD